MATYNAKGEVLNTYYYNCHEYGMLPSNLDNTQAFQDLIDLVYENGGGTIWIPVGTYYFDSEKYSWDMTGNITALLEARRRVSIIGESLDKTILKVTGNTEYGCGLFCQRSATSGEVLSGCTYSNFTVDMTEATLTNYSHRGKAFYFSGIKDCVFRDLRLLSTPSTALGIDMLDNVVIDSVYVYQGGRQWAEGGNGGAGIGIGTGKWENENFVIRNCICDECGHFGIFLEDQGIFSNDKTQNYSQGQIISNNIVRHGKNFGIGVRGGKFVIVANNNLYSNGTHNTDGTMKSGGGIYLDYGADCVTVSDNLVSDAYYGVLFGSEEVEYGSIYPCNRITVRDNTFVGCTNDIGKLLEPTNSAIEVSGLPDVSSSQNGQVLMVVDGEWAVVNMPTYADGNEVAY